MIFASIEKLDYDVICITTASFIKEGENECLQHANES